MRYWSDSTWRTVIPSLPNDLAEIQSSACKTNVIMGPSFLEGGPIMCWSCPSVCLSVCLSVPCLHLEGKRKSLRIPNLVGRVPGTPAPRGPISRSRGQRSRSRRLIALLAKNPHNFAACCPINLIFGKWRKDPLPLCTDLESPKTARTYSTARTAP